MKEPRNPFSMRSTETIESNLTFLKLFGPGALDALPEDSFLNKVTIFRSGPGGGKTSLFRIFRPESLSTIYSHRSIQEYKELFNVLKNFDVISNEGPKLLGIYLRLSDYASFYDLNISDQEKERFLFSLIDSRLVLKMLRGILVLKNLGSQDLNRIYIEKPVGQANLPNSPLPCTGEVLYNWASKLEENICGVLNRFDHNLDSSVHFYNELGHIYALKPENVTLDGKPVIEKTLVMLDDLHELRKTQRSILLKRLVPARYPVPIWVAERLEALELADLIPGITGREYDAVYLEQHWESSKGKTFENFVKTVSNKRAQIANIDFEISSFNQHLEESLDAPDWAPKFKNATTIIKNRIQQKALTTSVYDEWIQNQEKKIGTPKEIAEDWRALEIRIARKEKDAQKTLFDIPLPVEDDEESGIKAVSEFFIHEEFKIPYLYGFSRIAKLATSNVEQFLEMASELFEEIISKLILKKMDVLSATRQEEIVLDIARRRWNEIPKVINNGRDVARFLSSIGKFSREQTLLPNAPYSPGVTGIGLREKHYLKIIDVEEQKSRPEYKRLAEVLESCVSHNYLKATYDAKQGQKDSEPVTILYFNRLLCAHFGLPLGRGGWRYKTPDELCEWLGLQLTIREKKGRT